MRSRRENRAQRVLGLSRRGSREVRSLAERTRQLGDGTSRNPEEYASSQTQITAGNVSRRGEQMARNLFRRKRTRRMKKGTTATVQKIILAAKKAAAAGANALAAAAFSAGGVAVITVVLICLVAGVLASPMGIFFADDGEGATENTIPQVVREINGEYQERVEQICASVLHDRLEMTGERATWREILAVYAVKVTHSTEIENTPFFLSSEQEKMLRDVFWGMNEISVYTQEGNGTVLALVVSYKTAQEMVEVLGFDQGQEQVLHQLLSPEFDKLWASLLYGGSGTGGDLVAVALSQVGNMGGEPYWSWYGFSSRVEWCACFVSWCANQCGYLEDGVLPKFAGCIQGSNWFKARDRWQDRTYVPNPGDIIFFDWIDGGGPDGLCDHVGIVERVENGVIYTVEGNSGDMCRQNRYPVGDIQIYGFGMLSGWT